VKTIALAALAFAIPGLCSAKGEALSAGDVSLASARTLDLSSFPNSVGPQHRPGTGVPADYGFTKVERHQDGSVTLVQADDSWGLTVRVLKIDRDTQFICFEDFGRHDARYGVIEPIIVRKGRDGLLHATGDHFEDPKCLPYQR
jgi:hypothetical protein